jgi:alkyl hydroperoxide reductase subunit AhpC
MQTVTSSTTLKVDAACENHGKILIVSVESVRRVIYFIRDSTHGNGFNVESIIKVPLISDQIGEICISMDYTIQSVLTAEIDYLKRSERARKPALLFTGL